MSKRTPKAANIARAEEAIVKAAGSYPEVVEEGPWGHRAFKVRRKTFLFLMADAEGLSVSLKLPTAGKAALKLAFAERTGYGLGKAGWVTARFSPNDSIPLATVRAWLDESFRAIAPVKLVQTLDAKGEAKSASASAKVSKKAPRTKKKTASKRSAKK